MKPNFDRNILINAYGYSIIIIRKYPRNVNDVLPNVWEIAYNKIAYNIMLSVSHIWMIENEIRNSAWIIGWERISTCQPGRRERQT